MSRRPNAEPIYQAADLFRRTCFTTGRSLLWPERQAWTQTTLGQLWQAIIGQPDEGDRNFEEKLRDQLSPLPDDAHRAAAEAVGFFYLFSSKVRAKTKLEKVQEIISWRLKDSPANFAVLDQAFAAGGIGGPGTYYSMSKPWQVAYILKFAQLALVDQSHLGAPDACKAVADRALAEVPKAGESRNILLHLFFPDDFERIASRAHKERIAAAFVRLTAGAQDPDSALANIRKALATEYGRTDIDFYDPAIAARWRPIDEEDDIKESLEGILTGYVQARTSEPFGGESEMYQRFRRVETALAKCDPVRMRPKLRVKASPGQGNWSAVPWISFLDSRETATTQRGVYCVYLFREDMSGVYLTFNQGVTDPTKKEGWDAAERQLRGTVTELRRKFPQLRDQGFSLTDDIDLRTRGPLGESYEVSTIAHKFYPVGGLPSEEELLSDLDRVLETYGQYVEGKGGGEPTKKAEALPTLISDRRPRGREGRDLRAVVDEFAAALRESHVSFGSRHDEVVRSFVASIATKPFAILTGLSGSGKTQLALRFGEWLGSERSLVVPVRPDWTGAEALFGYEDALREVVNGRRAWHVPAPLAFMLRAAADSGHPYLLVLDEMNLAHVERYFADVLSGMESEYPCLPNLRQESDELWRLPPSAEPRLAVPRNLMVVGTVNVDETTYMFSPKVLDRANTFEFRVQTGDLEFGHQKPVHLQSGESELVAGFLAIAADTGWHLDHPAPGQGVFAQHLRTLHKVLSEGGFEFGHRVFYEAVRFAAMYATAGDDDPIRALDLQIMQKVLPRLHGSRRRLEATLCTVGRFCHDLTFDPQLGLRDAAARFDPLQASSAEARLPTSFDKVARMTRTLRTNQFVSFTE